MGLVAVTIFALGVPLTRLATGSADAPQLPGPFVAFGRAVIAGAISIAYLVATRAPWPDRADRRALAIIAGGGVIGFPLAMSVALRYVESVHVSAVIGIVPLITAVIGASPLAGRGLTGQRPTARFWAVASLGSLLVMAFPFARSGAGLHGVGWADLLLVGATFLGATANVFGARLARTMAAERVGGWSCVFALPVTVPLAIWFWPTVDASPAAWFGVAYVGVGTMWVGAFIWYRAMAIGGTVRVSQVLLVQPLIGMLFAVPILGEILDLVTVGFGLAIMATVFIGRRLAPRG